MLNAIVIDDEPKARELLTHFLKTEFEEVRLLGTGKNVKEGIDLIRKMNPDLVFLDIEMPQLDGFALLQAFEDPSFEVIFTTAHEHYAIKALRASATDYLLKPINIDELEIAVQRAIIKVQDKKRGKKNRLYHLLKNNLQDQGRIKKIALPNADEMIFVKVEEIIYLKAERAYTQVITKELKTLVSKPLRFFEELLTDPFFFRPHRSYLINLKRVHRLVKKEGGYIEMDNGDQVKLSSFLKQEFIEACQHYA